MGFLDDMFASSQTSPDPWAIAGKGGAQMGLNLPKLFQAYELLGFLGEDIDAFMGQFQTKKSAMKKSPLTTAKVGGKYYDMSAMSQSMPDLVAKAEAKSLENSQKKYELLKQQPQLATLAAQSEGSFDQNFMKVVDDQFNQVVSANLGGGAAQGFLNDPMKVATLTQPAAVQKAKYLFDTQQAAQGYLSDLSGLPSTQPYNPNLLLGPGGASGYMQGLMQYGQMGAQNNQFNAQSFLEWQKAVHHGISEGISSAGSAYGGSSGFSV